MECRDIREKIFEVIDGNGSVEKNEMLSAHIAKCDLCRRFYADAVLDRRLSRTLRDLPTPEPAPDFATTAVQYAVDIHRFRRRRSFFAGVAVAVLMLVAGISLVTGLINPAIQRADVMIPVGGERTVQIMIEAAAPRANAKLDIAIAGDVMLKGYAGRKRLQWQTDIRRGKNFLALPIQLHDSAGGQVNVRYAYDNAEREVSIQVRAEKTGAAQT
ncbi:MAG: hypothetical protein SWH61_01340 [Thermodesulfobacteriota bacterium]|nr:hypothetical protein [Thermodesulfobacteriota bacterium]